MIDILPMCRNMVAADLDAGVLFFFAVGAATELSMFMAGWSSRNKYSLLGAMRAIAQMISYEVPLVLSALTVVMAAGSLSTVKIGESQAGYWGVLPNWHVFTPWGLAGFVLFLIAGTAYFYTAPLEHVANPQQTPLDTMAPWYFLWLQGMLKVDPAAIIEGWFSAVGITVELSALLNSKGIARAVHPGLGGAADRGVDFASGGCECASR